MSVENLPAWIWDVLADIDQYEDEHGHPEDGFRCLANTLERVPKDVRLAAQAIKSYRRSVTVVREVPTPPTFAEIAAEKRRDDV